MERTNSWKGEGAKSITEWLSIETDCPQYEAQSVVLLANQLQHLPVTQAALRNGTLSNAQAVEVARGAIVAPNTETQLLNLAKQSSESGMKTSRPNVVMNIRVDIDALKRGRTEHGEICEIAGVGPIPVVVRLQSSQRLAGSGEHHPISGIPDDEIPSIGLCKKITDEKRRLEMLFISVPAHPYLK